MSEKEKYRKFNVFRDLCLKNAEDNLSAAKELVNKKVNHLRFHLCILSLEEVDKIFMTWMKLIHVENRIGGPMNIALDHHIKKLFFAIWVSSNRGGFHLFYALVNPRLFPLVRFRSYLLGV